METNLMTQSYNVTKGPKIEDHFSLIFATYHHLPIIISAYFFTVKVLGPKLMRGRKPFDIRTAVMFYNLTQVLFNCYLLYMIFVYWGIKGMLRSWNHICNPIGGTIGFDQTNQILMLKVMYYYYLNKILDLSDTVFFMLRKKQSHITFLHLFHHSTMIVSTWATLVYFREQVGGIFGTLNVMVHIVMYLYYFLSTFGPNVQKYLWWKKHLTRIQMVQFVIILTVLAKMKWVDCECSPWFWALWCFNISVFLGLFLNFYASSYTRKRKIV